MRLDRARITALLAALALTATGWMVAAPTASAGSSDVENCLVKSATYEDFKKCYKKTQADEDAAAKKCEADGGQWIQGACDTGE